MLLKQVIEALLFASPKPLQVAEVVSALEAAGERAEVDGPERTYAQAGAEAVQAAFEELKAEYEQNQRGFVLMDQVNGWALLTNPLASPWVRRLYPEAKPTRLSGPALETLAIIAYRQPVTRADIEAVRGVAVDGVMQVLLDRSLVKISGRAEVPGRPLLYGTTEFFLQHFGLKSVEELPNSTELKRYPLPTAATAETKAPNLPGAEAPEIPAPESAEPVSAEAAEEARGVSEAESAPPEVTPSATEE